MRQGFPFVIQDYNFTAVSLLVDGVNSQLSDLDFYNEVRKAFKSTGVLNYDATLPPYFRKNPFITRLGGKMDVILKGYASALRRLLEIFGMTMNDKASVLPMLDSMKNSLTGRVHYPHPHFMAIGTHAITL